MADQPTKTELLERARELGIEGRSSMDRDELAAAIAEAQGSTNTAPATGDGDTAGGTQPSGVTSRPTQRTDAQTSTAGIAAAGNPAPEPGTPEEVGRPTLASVAAERAANRKPRVIGAANQED